MPVKPGYKMTEVGVIPEDWKVNPLSSVINELIAGVSVRSDEAQTNSSGAFILKTSAISNGKFIPSQKKSILRADIWRARLNPKTDTIIISRMNTPNLVGEVGYVDNDHADLFLPDRLWMTSVSCETSAKWLSLLLSSDEYKTHLRSAATGTSGSMKNIAKPALLSLPIRFPPLPEQLAIAQTLSDVDALIESLSATLAKKRDIKQATMQQLLTGKTRLPGFVEEWQPVELGNRGQFKKGSGIRKDEVVTSGLACIRYGEIYTRHHDVVREFTSFISNATAARALRLKRGELLFAGSGETKQEIGKCVAFNSDREAFAGGDIVVFSPTEDDSIFLAYLMNSPQVLTQKASRGQGDAVVHISANALSQITFHAPPLPEQLAIAQTLTDLDSELTALEARIAKTRELKLGMMQELLTGKTRLI